MNSQKEARKKRFINFSGAGSSGWNKFYERGKPCLKRRQKERLLEKRARLGQQKLLEAWRRREFGDKKTCVEGAGKDKISRHRNAQPLMEIRRRNNAL